MNKKQIDALKELLDYLENDEMRHYEESGKPKSHIYRNIIALKKYLKNR